jgi:hypothetical protein
MTITDIDKQADRWIKEQLGTAGDNQKLRNLLHLIYDQAKAEQREEDAKVAEKEKFKLFDGSLSPSMKVHNMVCDSIASEIRGQHECKQTAQVSLQVKE